MFIGRENELKFLSQCYESGNAEFVVLYGRRRVGKTETLKEFCKGKPSVFYSCREYTTEKQLAEFSKALLSWRQDIKAYTDCFSDWDKAFSFIGEMEGDKIYVQKQSKHSFRSTDCMGHNSERQKHNADFVRKFNEFYRERSFGG